MNGQSQAPVRPTLDADVVVVGGGEVGLATAWQLAGRGVDVIVLERSGAALDGDTPPAPARLLRPAHRDPARAALVREALDGWRELTVVLKNTDGSAVPSSTDGSAVPSSTDGTALAGGAGLLTVGGGLDHGDGPALEELRAGLGAAGIAASWVSPDEARERWPGIRVDTRALHYPEGGVLHTGRAADALLRAAAGRGVLVRHHTAVTTIRVTGEDGVEVCTEGGVLYRARRVVVAAGARTAGLVAGHLRLPPLRVTLAQAAAFAPVDETGLDGWPGVGHLFAPERAGHGSFRGGVHAVATPGGVEVSFHAPGPALDPTRPAPRLRADLAAALEEYVRTWLPGLDGSTMRPITRVRTDVIGAAASAEAQGAPGVLLRRGPVVVAAATGGPDGHGLSLVPAIGRVVADLAVGRQGRAGLDAEARAARTQIRSGTTASAAAGPEDLTVTSTRARGCPVAVAVG